MSGEIKLIFTLSLVCQKSNSNTRRSVR